MTEPEEAAVERSGPTSDAPQWLVVYLKGIARGAADTVPGVSGGTIALVTGIYERLVRAITAIDPSLLRHATRLDERAGWAALGRDLVDRDVPFLLALGAGIVTAVVIVAGVMHAAVKTYPAPTYAFFFGLIGASAVVLYRYAAVENWRRVSLAVVGFLLAFVLSGETAAGAFPHTPLVVFFSGMIAITAMVLPGVSGAFILVLLGQYEFMSGVPGDLLDAIAGAATGDGLGVLVAPGTTVLTFVAGAAIGLLSIAHVIRWALDAYRNATLTFLVSLMVGALRLPVIEVLDNTGAWTAGHAAVIAGATLVGAVAVLGLDHFTDDMEY